MTPKQTAALAVTKLFAISVAYSILIAALVYLVPLHIIGILFGLGLVGYMLKMLYEMELDTAERLAKQVDKSSQ
jgi:hypothetical protein